MTGHQLDLPTAIAQGKNQAAACLEKTRQTKSDWPERAAKALQTFIWQQKMYDRGLVFTSEQAVQYCYDHGLTKAHDDRAFGGVLQKLAHKGVIKRSAITYQRAKGHGSIALKWEIV